MIGKLNMLFIFLLAFTLPWVGNAETSITTPSSDCYRDRSDPYDPHLRVNHSTHSNACLDTSLIRSIILLPPKSNKINHHLIQIRFANFTHKNQQWIADISPSGIEYVTLQMTPISFPTPSTHFQLHFHFRDAFQIHLSGQSSKNQGVFHSLNDLIFSPQVIPTLNSHASSIDASRKTPFLLAYRITSLAQRQKEMLEKEPQDSPTEQIRLDLNDHQKTNALLSAMLLSDFEGLQTEYDEARQNSATALFSIFDHSVLHLSIYQRWIDLNPLPLRALRPSEAIWNLWIRGIYDRKLPNFEDTRYQ